MQKTWSDGPYGRERQFYGPDNSNRNRLSTDALARLMHSLMDGVCVSAVAAARMQIRLHRSIDPGQRAADPCNPGGRLPGGSTPAW